MKKNILDLNSLTYEKLQEKIRVFEEKYGKSYIRFIADLDLDEAEPQKGIDQILWETFLEERKRRQDSGLIAMSVDSKSLFQVFTPKRLELLRLINQSKETTVEQIAAQTGRSRKSIYQDLKILEEAGLLVSRKEGRNLVLETPVNRILVDLTGH